MSRAEDTLRAAIDDLSIRSTMDGGAMTQRHVNELRNRSRPT